jgi:phenylpyruvate tautomerase PptA (4-oxalocrotonate tautomerase family)
VVTKPDKSATSIADSYRSSSRRTFIIYTAAVAVTSTLTGASGGEQPGALIADQHTSRNTEPTAMPLVRIDAYEGRTDTEVKTLLDAAHRAVVKAFHLNDRDRYQIYDARPRAHFIVQDTGLGIQRTEKALIITIVSKGRPEILKRRLYQEMTEELSRSAGVPPSDVMIAIIENTGADWTFGNGDPQFLSGELG